MFFKSGTILQACYLSTVKHPTGCVTFIGEEAAVCHFISSSNSGTWLWKASAVSLWFVWLYSLLTVRFIYVFFYACSGLVLHKHERHQCSSLTEQMKHFSVSICRSDHTTEALWLFRTSAYNNYIYYLEKYSPLSTPAHQTTAATTTKLKTGLYKSRGYKR